ncbi:UstYa family oxidase, partial [Sphaerulina musiva]
IPQSEARNLYDSTVPIWNMTGEYMIGVEVFHQLHCLDTIRKAAWPERYNHTFFFPNGTRDDFFTRHFGHCVENLRAAIVCHSDVTPVTFHWNRRMQSVVQKLETPHKCRNFEKIRRWAGERRV